jgi:hypothetical protein
MNFTPKQHLEIGNYVKYIDEILHKCDKGVEYCKICPNEFVCAELERDDFGLKESSLSDILDVIQYALNKIPGYLHAEKRNELKEHIRNYINESPITEQDTWKNIILDLLLDNKLANPAYKPTAKTGRVRTALTYDSGISFSLYLNYTCSKNEDVLYNKTNLHHEAVLNSTKMVDQLIKVKKRITTPCELDSIRYCFENGINERILQKCNLHDAGLAAALCCYTVLTQSSIPENIIITGGLDIQGRTSGVDFLDGKIETVLRELHYIDKIIIPRGSSFTIAIPEYMDIVEVGNLVQAIDSIFKTL